MTEKHSSLSQRGMELANNPARIDFELFMEAAQNLYCPKENPAGTFPLNIAENSLTATIIKNKLTAIVQKQEMPDWVLKYTDLLGHPEVRAEVASFMENYLCECSIDPATIGFSAGASAIIEVSSFVLASTGDVAVIPAPSYPMYTKDLGTKSGIERYDLQTHYGLEEVDSRAPVKTELLDEVFQELKTQQKNFKILLITSPDNPTGCRYNEQELQALADWCIAHKVHLVVNEIYGLSLIDTQNALIKKEYAKEGRYVSFAKIMAAAKSDYLHLWYAFSKDFSMSGLRFGVVHSLNEQFIKGFENANIPHLVSNVTQWMVGEMLKDTSFVETYIEQNKKLLNDSYLLVVRTLKRLGIPYTPSRGSLFIWADLSKHLREDSSKGQEQLWLDVYHNTGILLTPGEGFQHQKKGLFRIVFTAIPFDHLVVAMERLGVYLLKRQGIAY